tara:strand:- start:5086 stop:5337 length:252 start_codon:yes stop_codon:yes gene_type:complete
MNKAYQKGARFERKLVNAARKKGFIAFRSAGSHSKVDVVIINPIKKKISFIQAKKGKSFLKKSEQQEFEDMSDEYVVKFEVRK